MTDLRLCLVILPFLWNTAESVLLQRYNLDVNEQGAQFNETIYIDKAGNYEFIKVPKHRHLSALTVFNNFKKGYSIYKVDEAKTCYVVPLDKELEDPKEMTAGIKKVHSKFPYHKFSVEIDSFFPKGRVSALTSAGKTASQMCGNYSVMSATIFRGRDLNKFATAQLHKRAKADISNEKRVTVRDPTWVTCSKADMSHMINELNRCNGMINDMVANCRLSTAVCVYRVRCPYDPNKDGGVWNCGAIHRMHNQICCTYKCENPIRKG